MAADAGAAAPKVAASIPAVDAAEIAGAGALARAICSEAGESRAFGTEAVPSAAAASVAFGDVVGAEAAGAGESPDVGA